MNDAPDASLGDRYKVQGRQIAMGELSPIDSICQTYTKPKSIGNSYRCGIRKGLNISEQAFMVSGIGVSAPLISDKAVSSSFANSVIILNLAPKATPIWTKAQNTGRSIHRDGYL